MQDGDVDVIDADVVAGGDGFPHKLMRVGGVMKDLQRQERRNRNAFPDLTRPELIENRAGASDVIGVAVREDEIVQPTHTGGAQDWSDDAIADVERARARETTGIDEQRRTVREPDERRVALSDIEKRDVEAGVAAREKPRPGLTEDPESAEKDG